MWCVETKTTGATSVRHLVEEPILTRTKRGQDIVNAKKKQRRLEREQCPTHLQTKGQTKAKVVVDVAKERGKEVEVRANLQAMDRLGQLSMEKH